VIVSDDDLYVIANEIQFLAALLLKFSNQSVEARLHGRGEALSALQYGVLRMLEFERLSISEISQRMGIDPSTLVRITDVLERRGLAQRGVDPRDRRRNPIHITARGLELLAAVRPFAEGDPLLGAMQEMGVESAGRLRDLLRDLIRRLPEGKMIVDMTAGARPPQPADVGPGKE